MFGVGLKQPLPAHTLPTLSHRPHSPHSRTAALSVTVSLRSLIRERELAHGWFIRSLVGRRRRRRRRQHNDDDNDNDDDDDDDGGGGGGTLLESSIHRGKTQNALVVVGGW